MLNRMHALCFLSALMTAGALSACGNGGDDPAATTGGNTTSTGTAAYTGPTYHKDIAPLLQKHCMSCHRTGEIAPFALSSYAEASPAAGLLATTLRAGTMPPWGARDSDECAPKNPWADDLRLSEAEIATFEEWSKAGAPEGNPADAPSAYVPPDSGLPGTNMELTPAQGFVTSGDSDQFQCFVLDPKLTQQRFLNGVHFIPGNRKVVHHILLFSAPKAATLQKAPVGGNYTCFGGSGVVDSNLIGAWAPGGVPNELPSNIGTPLEADSLMIMQIHYHPGGTTADPDATKVQLRLIDTPPEYYLTTALIGNDQTQKPDGDGLQPGPNDTGAVPQFFIPANASQHTESIVFTLPDMLNGKPTPEIWIYRVAAHMHLVGVDEKISLSHAAGGEECLLHEPKWDFSWQRGYAYDAEVANLPRFAPGDKLNIRCIYENTKNNPDLASALIEQNLPNPVDVTLGESTLEEMCLTALGVLTKAP